MNLYGKKFLSICLALIAVLIGIMILKWGYSFYLGADSNCVRSVKLHITSPCAGKFGVFFAMVCIAEIFVMDYIQSKYLGD